MTYATVDDMTTLWRPMTKAEQARLGLRRQRMGVIELYGSSD